MCAGPCSVHRTMLDVTITGGAQRCEYKTKDQIAIARRRSVHAQRKSHHRTATAHLKIYLCKRISHALAHHSIRSGAGSGARSAPLQICSEQSCFVTLQDLILRSRTRDESGRQGALEHGCHAAISIFARPANLHIVPGTVVDYETETAATALKTWGHIESCLF